MFLKQYDHFHVLRGNWIFSEPTIFIVFLLNDSFYYLMLYVCPSELTEVLLLPIAFPIYYFHPVFTNFCAFDAYAHAFDTHFTISNFSLLAIVSILISYIH